MFISCPFGLYLIFCIRLFFGNRGSGGLWFQAPCPNCRVEPSSVSAVAVAPRTRRRLSYILETHPPKHHFFWGKKNGNMEFVSDLARRINAGIPPISVLASLSRGIGPAYVRPRQAHGQQQHNNSNTLPSPLTPFPILPSFRNVLLKVKQSPACW